MPSFLLDRGSEDQGCWPGGREEASPEEGAHVCWLHAGGPAGLQTQGHHGPEVQSQAGQEGGQGGGEKPFILFIKSSLICQWWSLFNALFTSEEHLLCSSCNPRCKWRLSFHLLKLFSVRVWSDQRSWREIQKNVLFHRRRRLEIGVRTLRTRLTGRRCLRHPKHPDCVSMCRPSVSVNCWSYPLVEPGGWSTSVCLGFLDVSYWGKWWRFSMGLVSRGQVVFTSGLKVFGSSHTSVPHSLCFRRSGTSTLFKRYRIKEEKPSSCPTVLCFSSLTVSLCV